MKKSDIVKIFLTGGHAATTALAVIDEVKRQKLPWTIFWVGAKYAIEGKKTTTLEYRTMPSRGVKFLPLIMGRLQRRFTVWTIPSLLKIPIGFVEAIYYLLTFRPSAVLSFGGYSAFPVVVFAKFFGIPVIIHEQTAVAGRANLASAIYADKIVLSRSTSEKFFPVKKTLMVGNPVSESMFMVPQKKQLTHTPTIFVTGGSRGSQAINDAILEVLPRLLNNFRVEHQTGDGDIEKFEEIKKTLPYNLAKNYHPFAYLDPSKTAKKYDQSDLIISRSGANTISEILAVKRPAIVVPLPIGFLDEQTENAKILLKYGLGKIIPQSELNGRKLYDLVTEIFSSYGEYFRRYQKFKSPDKEAATNVVNILKNFV